MATETSIGYGTDVSFGAPPKQKTTLLCYIKLGSSHNQVRWGMIEAE